jgi:hypothetical protein
MNYSLGNMLGGSNGSLNPDKLSLDLQFATDKSLTARKGPTPTFTRASTATFVGSDGLIQSAAVNAARFDHDPVTLASKGLLIEESRTNLLSRSEEINDAVWVKALVPPVSIVADVAVAPNGTTTADILRPATLPSNTNKIERLGLTLTNVAHTATVFLKSSGYNFAELIIGNNVSYTKFATAYFDLSTGQFVSSRNTTYTVASQSITSFGNGWYRCSLTVITDANSTGVFNITCGSTSNPTASFTGDGTSGILIWGAQLEAGSFPTSYIPTTTASVVRSVDLCSITGAAFTGFWNRFAGTCVIGVGSSVAVGGRFVSNNSAARVLEIWSASLLSNIDFLEVSGGQEVRLATGITYPIKVGLAYAINDYQTSYNGLLGGFDTNTGGTIPDPNALHIGNLGGSAPRLTGHIASIRYFKKRLSNAKLQALTV